MVSTNPSREVLAAPRPISAAELLERAQELETRGDLNGASAVLRCVVKAPSHAGRALTELARVEALRGRPHEALSTYKWALHHLEEPRQVAWVYAEIGELYAGMQEGAEAEYYFRRAAGLDPRHVRRLESLSAQELDLRASDTVDIDLVTIQ